jgi:hypothetical protein
LQALDLGRSSDADPRDLLQQLAERGMVQELAVNDLEQPAFDMCATFVPVFTCKALWNWHALECMCSLLLLQVCAKRNACACFRLTCRSESVG